MAVGRTLPKVVSYCSRGVTSGSCSGTPSPRDRHRADDGYLPESGCGDFLHRAGRLPIICTIHEIRPFPAAALLLGLLAILLVAGRSQSWLHRFSRRKTLTRSPTARCCRRAAVSLSSSGASRPSRSFSCPPRPQTVLQKMQTWNPASHPELDVWLHQALPAHPTTADFSALNEPARQQVGQQHGRRDL